MNVAFPEIRVGDPIRHEGMSVFPLFADLRSHVDYELSDAAMDKGTVTVEEVSQSGSVPDLAVENDGDQRVLFLEGEELVGAKQNRILNTSVLIAAHSKARIPVSCVEAGRWAYRSPKFCSSGHHSPSKLRRLLKASVTHSLKARGGYRSDQGGIWREVARQQAALEASSPTSEMKATFEAHSQRIADFREKLRHVPMAIGAAVAIGGQVVSVDVFDKPGTCGRVWERLLSGLILDALESKPVEQSSKIGDVERVLEILCDLPWESAQPVGEGEEYRAATKSGDHASALVLDGTLVHGSIVCAS